MKLIQNIPALVSLAIKAMEVIGKDFRIRSALLRHAISITLILISLYCLYGEPISAQIS